MKKDRSHPNFEVNPPGFVYHEIIPNQRGKPIDYRFKMVNEAFERITGLKSADIIDKTLQELETASPKLNSPWLAIYKHIDLQKNSGTSQQVFKIPGKKYRIQSISDKKNFLALILSEFNDDLPAEKISTPWPDNLEVFFENTPDGIYIIDLKGKFLYLNKKAMEITGYKRDELIGNNFFSSSILSGPSLQKVSKLLALNRLGKCTGPDEMEIISKDNRHVWLEINTVPVKIHGKTIVLVFARDISQRRKVEDELRRKSQLQNLLLELAATYINIPLTNVESVIDTSLRRMAQVVDADRAYVFSYDFKKNICRNTHEWCGPKISPQIENLQDVPLETIPDWVNTHRRGEAMYIPDVYSLPEGGLRDILEAQDIKSLLAVPMIFNTQCIGFVGFDSVRQIHHYDTDELKLLTFFAQLLVNVQDRKQVESQKEKAIEALREIEETQRKLIHTVPDLIIKTDPQGNITFLNEKALAAFSDLKRENILGKNMFSFFTEPDQKRAIENFRMMFEKKLKPEEYQLMLPDHRNIYVEVNGDVIHNKDGNVSEMVFVIRDITDRKQAEAQREAALLALRESEEKYRQLIQHSGDAIYLLYNRRFEIINEKFEELFGLTFEDINKPEFDFINLVAPKSRPLIEDRIQRKKRGETLEPKYELTVLNARNEEIEVEISVTYIKYKDGIATQGIIRDITERKKLEREFRQAQKMESVGRLAGGVAHDFNNMLGVILGYSELALSMLGPEHPFFDTFQHIRKAAQHSADLTRQLLAFARKQTVVPKVLNLNDAVEGMLKMMQRLMGEAIDLVWRPGKNLGKVKIDPSQIDQILANLCVNARDAIGYTGKVTIETHSAIFDDDYCKFHPGSVPGKYLLLSVSDTGCGMNAETLSHIFEPFFTTKKIGQGTGLGLATVYGIVKQNNGFINVYSEPGFGTTFKIYIPQYMDKPEQTFKNKVSKPVQRGYETILLVEDEPTILDMTTSMLEQLGYKVLASTSPAQAIALAQEYEGDIHLLMTDVIMPEMNGRDLANKLLTFYPDLKSLFMSGYTADVIAHHGVLDDNVHFVQKPFTIRTIADKIRSMLN